MKNEMRPNPRTKSQVVRSPFGEYLRNARHHNQRTLKQLSEQVRTGPSHICYIETGRCHPRRHLCDRFANALGIDPDACWEVCKESKRAYGRKKSSGGKKPVGARVKVTVPRDVFEWIEFMRGDVPRSQYAGRIVTAAMAANCH